MYAFSAPIGGALPAVAALALWAAVLCSAAALAERTVARCAAPRSQRLLPYVLTIGVATAAVLARPPAAALATGAVAIALVAAAPADLRTGLLFDAVTLPAAVAAIALAVAFGRAEPAFEGVFCVDGFFALLVTVSRGVWMGLGDVKAIFAISAAFGPIESVLAVFVACVSGVTLAVVRPRALDGRALPFGPHLAVGACAVLVAGPFVEHAWMHLA